MNIVLVIIFESKGTYLEGNQKSMHGNLYRYQVHIYHGFLGSSPTLKIFFKNPCEMYRIVNF